MSFLFDVANFSMDSTYAFLGKRNGDIGRAPYCVIAIIANSDDHLFVGATRAITLEYKIELVVLLFCYNCLFVVVDSAQNRLAFDCFLGVLNTWSTEIVNPHLRMCLLLLINRVLIELGLDYIHWLLLILGLTWKLILVLLRLRLWLELVLYLDVILLWLGLRLRLLILTRGIILNISWPWHKNINCWVLLKRNHLRIGIIKLRLNEIVHFYIT